MIRFFLRALWILPLLLIRLPCNAQTDLSAGIDIGLPMVITHSKTMITAGQISSGLHAGIVYKPDNAQFFPGLSCAYGRSRLPLQTGGRDVAALNFNYLDVMLNENLEINLRQGNLFVYGGIGFSHLNKKSVAPSGVQTIVTTIDSVQNIRKIFPTVNLGIEYHYGENSIHNFYVAIGAKIFYTALVADRNIYYVTVSEPGNNIYHHHTDLTGGLMKPCFYVALHYKIHKKKSSQYL